MSWLDALLGKIRNNGTDLELEGALNFTGGLRAVSNPTSKSIDVSVNTADLSTYVVFEDYAEYRALTAPLLDKQIAKFRNPTSEFICSTSLGAGFADDNNTILKRSAVDVNAPERLFTTAPVLTATTVDEIRAMLGLYRNGVIQARLIHLVTDAVSGLAVGTYALFAGMSVPDDGDNFIVAGDITAVKMRTNTPQIALGCDERASWVFNGNNEFTQRPEHAVTVVTDPTAAVTLRCLFEHAHGTVCTIVLKYDYSTTIAHNYTAPVGYVKPYLTPTGADLVLPAPGANGYNLLTLQYDATAGTSGAWRVLSASTQAVPVLAVGREASGSLLVNGNNDSIAAPTKTSTTVTGPTADVVLRGMYPAADGTVRTLFLVYNYKTTVTNAYGSLSAGVAPFLSPTGGNFDLTAPGSAAGAYNALSVMYDASHGSYGAWRVTGWVSA